MYSARERERRRILAQGWEKLSHGLGVFEQEVDKCRRLFYSMIFKLNGKRRYSAKKNKRRRRVIVVIIKKHVRKWLVRCAYLKFLAVTTFIQCCWRKVLEIREFWRLEQEANIVTTDPIQDLRGNLLKEGGNDTVQPCDTNQARSDSDFGVKFSTFQFYVIEHNFKSNRWIKLKLYQKIPEVFVYVGVHFQENPPTLLETETPTQWILIREREVSCFLVL